MIEILFTKGYVKMLFATETFAVGLNMPTKTVLFTSLKKYDGREHRYLLPHEYTQQAGRAGRRGYDTVGHVIHLSNLFEPPTSTDYKIILGNVPQKIVSKLKISYSMVLNCVNVSDFVNKSAIQHDIQKEIKYYQDEIQDKNKKLEALNKIMSTSLKTPINVLNTIINTEDIIVYCKYKKQMQKQRELNALYDEYPSAKKELEYVHDRTKLIKEIEELESRMKASNGYVETQISAIHNILEKNSFIDNRANIARNIKETHPLMMTDMLKLFSACDAMQLIGLFSCFTNINVSDEFKNYSPAFSFEKTQELIEMARSKLDYYYNEEIRTNIYSGADYNIHFDLVDDVIRWCKLTEEKDCERFLLSLQKEKGIFIGEFVKAILKINAIAKEMEKICEMCGMNDVQHILSQVGELTLKSVCTNQSLYV
jgi:superfamily II RNA helicase